jgi:hypothetical protein
MTLNPQVRSVRIRIGSYRVETWLILAGVFVLLCFAIVQHSLMAGNESSDLHFLGVPLDDVYIHAQFAKNLLQGSSYSFQAGQTLTADTSPLWVALIAFGGLFTVRLELVAIALSMLAYLAIGPGMYRVARDVFGMSENHARLAGFVTVLSSRLIWGGMSGMETALAALLMLLVIEEHIRSRKRNCIRVREAIWLGMALLVRPEFMFVALILSLDWIAAAFRNRSDSSEAPLAILAVIGIASPAFLLPLLTRNSLISHSSVVQGAGISFIPNIAYLLYALKILASNNVIIFVFLLAAVWLLRRKSEYYTLYIIAVGLPILQSFIAPQFRHSGRYFFPVFPLIILLGIGAWKEIEQKIHTLNSIKKSIVILILLAGFIQIVRWSFIAAESVRNINDQHLAVVGWLRQNMRPNDTLAVDDVGMIGFFLNKPVIDLTGLMTPSLWLLQHDQDSVWRSARKSGANLFLIYRRLNPPFYEQHKDSLILQHEFPVRLPLASAADTIMSIYRVKEQ